MLEMKNSSAKLNTGVDHDSKLRKESLRICEDVSMETLKLKSKGKKKVENKK